MGRQCVRNRFIMHSLNLKLGSMSEYSKEADFLCIEVKMLWNMKRIITHHCWLYLLQNEIWATGSFHADLNKAIKQWKKLYFHECRSHFYDSISSASIIMLSDIQFTSSIGENMAIMGVWICCFSFGSFCLILCLVSQW